MAKQKKETTDETLKKLEALFGIGTVVSAASKQLEEVKEKIPTTSISLNLATYGGIPKDGKVTCILGKESSSKTTLGLDIIANEQKKGGTAVFIDIEGTLSLNYASSIGVDLNKLHIIDDKSYLKELGVKDRDIVSGEEWLELTAKIIQSDLFDVICLDSVAALIPMADISNGLVGGKLGSQASMAARGYKLINASLKDRKCAFIYLNQYRLSPGSYIPIYEPFGEAWKYLQSLKLEISKSLDKDADGVYGIIVKGKVTKSKICRPFGTFEYYVEFGKGIVPDYEITNSAIELGIIVKTGNTFSYENSKLGVGMAQLEQFFKDNTELLEEIKVKVLDKLQEIPVPEEVIEEILPEPTIQE